MYSFFANQNVFPTKDGFLRTLDSETEKAARKKKIQGPKNINEIGKAQGRKKKENKKKRNQLIVPAQNPFP